jgi:hypothetical protein
MVNNVARLFLSILLFLSCISSAVGAEIMPENYIVKINNIRMYRSIAEKIFKYSSTNGIVEIHDAKNKNVLVSEVKKDMDVVMVSNFVYAIVDLYENCLNNKNIVEQNGSEYCTKSCNNLHYGKCIYLCVNKNERLITELLVY